MATKVLLTDIDLCYGCHSCEVACKQEHNLPAGPRWIRVVKVGPQRLGGKLVMNFNPSHCQHCAKPACLEACPEDAISKRTDGIVVYHDDRCTGCMACIEACPFGSPQFNEQKGVVQKCDLCVQRVDQGLDPACVHHCPTGALFFGDPNDFADQIRKRRSKILIESRLASAVS
ncbi:MAG: 4Fe-4S dicluster domain-containing protein [Chloroflexi bacterium]|nr:4Fe-4S dicluster domain-containing protein [Chloroflexota bacterium]